MQKLLNLLFADLIFAKQLNNRTTWFIYLVYNFYSCEYSKYIYMYLFDLWGRDMMSSSAEAQGLYMELYIVLLMGVIVTLMYIMFHHSVSRALL